MGLLDHRKQPLILDAPSRRRPRATLVVGGRRHVQNPAAVLALMQWSDEHLRPEGGPLRVVERATGAPVAVRPRSRSGRDLDLDDLAIVSNDGWAAVRRA